MRDRDRGEGARHRSRAPFFLTPSITAGGGGERDVGKGPLVTHSGERNRRSWFTLGSLPRGPLHSRALPTHPLITHYIPPVPQAPSYRHSPSEPDVVDNEWCERLLSRVTAISPRKKVPRDRQVAPVPSHPLRSSCFLATLCGWDEPWAKGERRDTATRATMERLIIGNRWKGEDFK